MGFQWEYRMQQRFLFGGSNFGPRVDMLQISIRFLNLTIQAIIVGHYSLKYPKYLSCTEKTDLPLRIPPLTSTDWRIQGPPLSNIGVHSKKVKNAIGCKNEFWGDVHRRKETWQGGPDRRWPVEFPWDTAFRSLLHFKTFLEHRAILVHQFSSDVSRSRRARLKIHFSEKK